MDKWLMFAQKLESIGLQQWQQLLQMTGAFDESDVSFLTDSDLAWLGMSMVEIRKIRTIAPPVAMFDSEAWMVAMLAYANPKQKTGAWKNTSADIDDAGVCVDEELRAYTSEISEAAYRSVKDAIDSECPRHARQYLWQAIQCFHVVSKDPREAVQAFDLIGLATGNCCSLFNIYAKITTARNAMRDTIIVRVQCQVPMGYRAVYITELQNTLDRYIDKIEFSQLMHSYQATIGKKFPQRAFLSNAKREARRRQRSPRSKRCRDYWNAQCLQGGENLVVTDVVESVLQVDMDVPRAD